LASSFAQTAVAETLAPPRRTTTRTRVRAKRRARARSGIVWIAVSAVLLAGVVFVNVAVLRLNLQLDKANQQRSNLNAQNAALQSELSSELASPRIQAIARHHDGLVPADPSTIGYIDLGR
jgi:cell division protein FtsL